MKYRIIIGTAAFIAGCLLAGCRQGGQEDGQQLFIGDDIAIAQTEYGAVRGFILRGTYQFRGIPYGAPTSGKNRFMPPVKPEPWEGVRLALNYGDMAPQPITYDRSPESASGSHALS